MQVKNVNRREDPLQIVLDNTMSSVYVCDLSTYEIIFANKALKSKYTHEIEGQKCWKVLSNFDGPCPFCKLKEVMKQPLGIPYVWENHNVVLKRWFHISQSYLTWIDGRNVHLVTLTDVTDIKNHELQLQDYKVKLEELLKEKTESEEKLQSINDNMPDAFSFQLLRRKGNSPIMLYAGKGIEQICGLKTEELMNNTSLLYKQLHPADSLKLTQAIEREKPFILELRYTNPATSELKYLEFSEKPRQNYADQIVWDGLVIDITKRKLIENKLRQSQEELLKTNLVNQISTNLVNGAIYRSRLTPSGHLSLDFVSSNVEQLSSGITAEAMEKDLNIFFNHVHPDERKEVEAQIRHNNSLLESASLTFRYISGNKVRWYKIQSMGSMDKDDIVHDGILLDITDQKQLEEELIKERDRAEESDKLKTTFMANMSHEIRTPMNAILGFLELIFSEDILLEDDMKKNFVRIITDNANQLMGLINDLLDISKLDAGQVKINPMTDDLDKLIRDVHTSFLTSGTSLLEKDIDLIYDIPEEGKQTMYCLDFFRLRQILNNLIGNAIKFTDKGHVKYGYHVKNRELHFYVEDTGIGISPDKIAEIGRPFHQVHDQSKAVQYGGTGIGLAISKNLIELMGGSLQIHSVFGKGTRFEFVLSPVE